MKFKIPVDSGALAICDLTYSKQFISGEPMTGRVFDVEGDTTHLLGFVKYMALYKAVDYQIKTPSRKVYVGDIGQEENTEKMWNTYCGSFNGPFGKEIRMGGDGWYIIDLEMKNVTERKL